MTKIRFEKLMEWKGKIFGFLRPVVSLLVYIVSVLFAFDVLAVFVWRAHPTWIWIALGTSVLLCNSINFFLSRQFPKRFYSWGTLFEDPQNVRRFMFFPPFSTGVSSVALTIFILNLFSKPISLVWQESITRLDDVYRMVGEYFILAPLALIVGMAGFVACFFVSVRLLKRVKLKLGKVLIVVFFAVTFGLWLYFICDFLFSFFDKELSFWAKQAVKYLVSFTPAYWFYLLFINSKRM